jgi:hypothetical protein
VARLADETKIPIFVMNQETQIPTLGRNLVNYLHPEYRLEAKAISAVVAHYSWERCLVVTSETIRAMTLEKSLEWEPYSMMSYIDGLDQSVAVFLIGKGFKRLGTRVAVILTEGPAAKQLLQAAETKHVATAGYGYLLSQQSVWFTIDEENDEPLELLKNGQLFVAEQGFETVTSQGAYQALSITKFLNFIVANVATSEAKTNTVSPEIILKIFEDSYKPKLEHPVYSVVNVQDFVRKIVGSVEDRAISMTEEVVFPGQVPTPPPWFKVQIGFSIAGPYEGTLFSSWWPKHGHAIDLALTHINDPNLFPEIFPYHEAVCHQIKVGQFRTDEDFMEQGLIDARDSNTLGIAHINSFASGVAMNVMLKQAELGIEIPNIGVMNTSPSLSDVNAWPNFHRVRASSKYGAVVLMRWIKGLKWSSFCIVHDDSSARSEFAQIILDTAASFNIKIANQEIFIPLVIDEPEDQVKEKVEPIAEEIWDTDVRIVFLFVRYAYIEAMVNYFIDYGAEEGDLILIGFEQLSMLAHNGQSPDEVEDWQKLYLGSISVFQSYLAGEFGDWYLQEYTMTYGQVGNSESTCGFYDAAHVISRASSLLLDIG